MDPFLTSPDLQFRRLSFIREETRFEVNLLHGRVNGLISAEAFLTIAYTAAMSNTNPRWGATFSHVVSPLLATVGLLLAMFSWPGVVASFNIILALNRQQLQVMAAFPDMTEAMWRSSVPGRNRRKVDPDQRVTMLFARTVPAVFAVAWLILLAVALIIVHRWTRSRDRDGTDGGARFPIKAVPDAMNVLPTVLECAARHVAEVGVTANTSFVTHDLSRSFHRHLAPFVRAAFCSSSCTAPSRPSPGTRPLNSLRPGRCWMPSHYLPSVGPTASAILPVNSPPERAARQSGKRVRTRSGTTPRGCFLGWFTEGPARGLEMLSRGAGGGKGRRVGSGRG